MRLDLLALLLPAACAAAAAVASAAEDADRAAIQAVVESAYIQGVHVKRDPALMRAGFDPAFRMQVLREGSVESVTLDDWASRIEKGARENPGAKADVKHEFALVDHQGSAAVARVELWRDGRHVFTDYLSLYKLPDGWKIAAKIFYAHPR